MIRMRVGDNARAAPTKGAPVQKQRATRADSVDSRFPFVEGRDYLDCPVHHGIERIALLALLDDFCSSRNPLVECRLHQLLETLR
jgi:hypothetical protein